MQLAPFIKTRCIVMLLDSSFGDWVPVHDSFDSASDALDCALDHEDHSFRIWQFDPEDHHPRDVTLDAIEERHALFASETPPRDYVICASLNEREALAAEEAA